jgi:folate-binding Fe-S cluster repair protein YgfZ
MQDILTKLSLIQISGPDCYKFLQGQFTADLDLLDTNKSILSAYCNQKGRVIAVFYILKYSDDYLLIILGDIGYLME